ncbi:MAG: type II secretion system secretin GspD [Pseudomonadota bacterium]
MKTHSPLTRRPNLWVAAMMASLLCTTLGTTPVFAQTKPAPASSKFKGEPVTLNFVNADIEGVSRAMGAILKQQFIVDPRVKGNITVYSEQPLSPREAYLNYLAALRGLGFAVVEVGGLYKVVPEADAKLQTGSVSVGEVSRRGDQIVTQIFTLNHENANNLVPVLRPLISPNNTINANPGNNSLVITDYADNLQRIAKIIASMDVGGAGDVEVIPLKHAVASDIAAMVQKMSDGTATAGAAPGGPSGGISVLVDTRSNSLLVKAPNPARVASIRSLVAKLDQPTLGGGAGMGNIWVVYLKNADATKLATVLRAAYSVNGSGAGGGGGAGGGLGQSVSAQPNNAGGMAAGGGQTPATAPVSASAGPSTGGFIQADPSTNSLIITAPEPLYRQLRAVIDQLDSRRAQVYIESMIVKVDARKLAEIGFQWQGLLGRSNSGNAGVVAGTNFGTQNNIINLAAGAAGATGSGGQLPLPGGGLNVGYIKKIGGVYTLAALANFLETNTDGNVLSTPNLISLDNEEAKIVIGQNIPIKTGSSTSSGSGFNNPFTTIERKDVGLTLRVKPQIGEAGTVRMTIYQENSSVADRTNPDGIITDKSAIEATVVVDDGQIMVLGGLFKDEYSGGESKVPGLGDIPVMGNLFKYDNRSRSKSNLMVFLRPVVIRTQEAADALTMDRYDMIRATQQDSQPRRNLLMPESTNESPVLPERPPEPNLKAKPSSQRGEPEALLNR